MEPVQISQLSSLPLVLGLMAVMVAISGLSMVLSLCTRNIVEALRRIARAIEDQAEHDA